MSSLNLQTRHTLPDAVQQPDYDPADITTGIVHIGPGAFHRAHQAVYTDSVLHHDPRWGIHAVSMHSTTAKDQLSPQDNLYTLVVLDHEPRLQVIGALTKVSVLGQDRAAIMQDLCAPTTHIISLTITEKGYCLNRAGELDTDHDAIRQDLANPDTPQTAIGLLVAALACRYQEDLGQVTIISCDNLTDNGRKLAGAVTAFARLTDPALASWIEQHICFPNTMVDSITPATDESVIDNTRQQLGLHDAWPIQREAFSQWVIEDTFSGPRPPWEQAGVQFTRHVQLYEKAKLRVLNGTHSTLAYLGSLAGFDTVYNAISHPDMHQFICTLLNQEILPGLDGGGEIDLAAYANAIVQRYQNPHIRHLLAQIAWDGSQKIPFRILGSVRENLQQQRPITCLCVPVAAWIVFIFNTVSQGKTLTDPMQDTLTTMATQADTAADLASTLLAMPELFGDLCDEALFTDAVKQQVVRLNNVSADTLADALVATS